MLYDIRVMAKLHNLNCPTCGSDFQHVKKTTKHCSRKCAARNPERVALTRSNFSPYNEAKKAKADLNRNGICLHCKKEFYSKYGNKLFCSMGCYAQSDYMKRVRKERAEEVKKQFRSKINPTNPDEPLTKICLNCEKDFEVSFTLYKTKKFCSRSCYREYLAARFDRWIANPETIALPQNYDEFLTKGVLPCLIEGCSWAGENLSVHVNHAHGIKAADFKKIAGFNKTSGLVTSELSRRLGDALREITLQKMADGTSQLIPFEKGDVSKRVRPEMTLEGREHVTKSIHLRRGVSSRTGICANCQKAYTSHKVGRFPKYCSIECRANYYENQYLLNCSYCNKEFKGDLKRKTRVEKGLEIFCSHYCLRARDKVNRQVSGKTYLRKPVTTE